MWNVIDLVVRRDVTDLDQSGHHLSLPRGLARLGLTGMLVACAKIKDLLSSAYRLRHSSEECLPGESVQVIQVVLWRKNL